MQRTDIASTLGAGIQTVKYTVTYSDLTTAGAAQTLYPAADPGGNPFLTPSTTAPPNASNFQIPQCGAIQYVKVHQTTAFTGGGLTALTLSVGKLGGSNTFVTTGYNIFPAAADGTLQETFAVASGQISAWGVTFTFTATGANVNAATAGSVDIYLTYLNVTSPLE